MLDQMQKKMSLSIKMQLNILKQMQQDQFTYKTPIQFIQNQKQIYALALTSKYLCFGIIQTNDILFQFYIPITRQLQFQKIFCPGKLNIIGFKLIHQHQEINVYIKDLNAIAIIIDKLALKLTQNGFHNQYKPIRKVGKGGFATVYQVRRYSDNRSFAAKAFSKQKVYSTTIDQQMIQKQIFISRILDHKNLLHLYQIFQSQHSIYLVMQLYQGGDLIGLIKKTNDVFTNTQIVSFMKDLLTGLKYLDERQIMHRDIKPQNVMIRNTQQGYRQLVIVDFGLAEYVHLNKYLLEKCGTPGYVAPEVAHFKHGDRLTTKCDVFSLGVIFHLLTCRSHLFEGSSSDQVYQKNRNLDFNLFDPKYNSINPIIMDLLRKMLTSDISHRISISEALKHPFFATQNNLGKGFSAKQSSSIKQKHHVQTQSTLSGIHDYMKPVRQYLQNS